MKTRRERPVRTVPRGNRPDYGKHENFYRSLGERILKNQEKDTMNGSATMMISVDKMLIEVGKLHLQVQQANEQFSQMQHDLATSRRQCEMIVKDYSAAQDFIAELGQLDEFKAFCKAQLLAEQKAAQDAQEKTSPEMPPANQRPS